jgi:hypothetical protein
MDIVIKRRKTEAPGSEPAKRLAQPSPYDKRYGEWGRVETLHSEDNTVDVFLDIGVYLKRVPVSSWEWVVPGQDAGKDYNSGERNLPPEQARVFIMMPTGAYDGSFVLCSGFATIDQTQPYMTEGREKIKERITPSGWHITDDNVTGSHKAVSPDEKTRLELDYGTEDEPKAEPELHVKLFDGDVPGVKADVVCGKTLDIAVFEDLTINHDTEAQTTDFNLFEDTVIHHKKGDVLGASFFEELLLEHKKGEHLTADAFDGEMRFEHKKGDAITVKTFEEGTLTHKKGEAVSGDFFGGEARFTHKKGDSTVIKAFDSEITLKRGKVIIKTSGMIEHNVPTYKFTGNTSVGRVTPKGSGVYCAIAVCPFSGLPQTG